MFTPSCAERRPSSGANLEVAMDMGSTSATSGGTVTAAGSFPGRRWARWHATRTSTDHWWPSCGWRFHCPDVEAPGRSFASTSRPPEQQIPGFERGGTTLIQNGVGMDRAPDHAFVYSQAPHDPACSDLPIAVMQPTGTVYAP